MMSPTHRSNPGKSRRSIIPLTLCPRWFVIRGTCGKRSSGVMGWDQERPVRVLGSLLALCYLGWVPCLAGPVYLSANWSRLHTAWGGGKPLAE